jgi:SWI/SNF-related matrix-associated actin-dependent regulator 1 of chromatin subfamily A
MIITYWKGVFVVDRAENMVGVLKKAGFELHEPTLCKPEDRCRACRAKIGNRYWSSRVTAATRMRPFCNQVALRVMKNHLEKLARSRSVTSDIIIPSPPGLTFLPYQRAGVAFMLNHKDTLEGDDMGLGKTIIALGFVNVLREQSFKPTNILVLCPGTLTFNWRNEAAKWLHKPMELVLPTSTRFEVPRRNNLFVVVNYEKITRDNPLTRSLRRVWDVLVCDEAQALKNPKSQRSIAVLHPKDGLMQRAHRCEFLTGTPLENYPKELWPIAAAICPAKFGDWTAFARRYCGMHVEPGRGLVDTGSGNLGELQQRLRASFMIRRLKGDVLKELPPKRRQLIVLGNSKVDWSRDPAFARWKALYDAEYEAKLAALEAAHTQAEYKTAAKSLEEFTGVAFQEMSEFRHKTALAKLPACIEYIDKILETGIEKLVIFAHHQDVLDQLVTHYGPQAVALHGRTKSADREAIVHQFQAGSARIFIGGLKAAGVGLNLFVASTVVFIEIDWNPAVLTQAEDRLCRLGQKKMVHVIHLVLEGTLDINIVKRIIAKQNVIDKALNLPPEHGLKVPQQLALTLGGS